jgi:ACS family hexuronate transporter-like MFS transporter
VREGEGRPPLTESKRGALLLGMALMTYVVITGMAISLVPVVAPEMQDRFGLSASEIGLLTSMFMLTTSLGAIPMGLAGARWGGRTLVASGILFVIGLALFAVASSYPWFLVCRLLQGIGASAAPPVATTLMTKTVHPRYHGWTLGAFGCGQGMGVLLALLIMPSIQAAAGYRATFLAAAGIAALLVVASLARGELRSVPQAVPAGTSLGAMLRSVGSVALNPRLLLLILVNIGAMALFVGVLTWTPSFLHDQRGTSLAVAAYLTAGIGLAQLLGAPFGATLMARLGKGVVMAGGIFLMLVATCLVPIAPGVAGVFVCVVVGGFLTLAMLPAILGSVPEVVSRDEQVGAATGYMYTVNLVATMLAPWLFGILLDAYGGAEGDSGYVLGYQMLGLFAIVGLVSALVLLGVNRRRAVAGASQVAIPEVIDS